MIAVLGPNGPLRSMCVPVLRMHVLLCLSLHLLLRLLLRKLVLLR